MLRPGSFPGTTFVRWSYDLSHFLSEPWQKPLEDSAVVLVYLDLESYLGEHQNPAAPWDRQLHARLLDRLTDAGAKAIVFDILFSNPGPDPEADALLRAAIQRNGRVILASDLNNSSLRPEPQLGGPDIQKLNQPTQRFLEVAAATGLANVIVDDDFVIRRRFGGFASVSTLPLADTAVRVASLSNTPKSSEARWLRYYGRALTLPHVGYRHALDPAAVPREFFRNKIVFIGAKPMTSGFTELRDEFRSPFPSWRRDLFMPAVEVHATQALNLVRGDGLTRFEPVAESFVLGISAITLTFLLLNVRLWIGTGCALIAELLLLGCVISGFCGWNLWFPWTVIAGLQIPGAWAAAVVFHSLEWRRARLRLEAERRISEQKIREQAALIDKARDAILVRNLEGVIVYANPSAATLYGWAENAFQNPGVVEQLFAPCSEMVAEATEATRRHGEWTGEMRQATRTGEIRVVRSRWTLIRDQRNAPQAILLINSDITHEKQLESQVLRTQRLEAVWSLAGGMAHDLSNSLAPVLMGIQRLQKRVTDPESQRTLSVIEANTQRGADMVRQVLAFSRGQDGHRELLALGRHLREMERIVAQTFPKGISVAVMSPPDLWSVRANATQLHQVLLNLAVNARDAMPHGGLLTLAADNVALSEVEAKQIPKATPGNYVMLLVSDTGTGIPPDVMAHLFEPFFTTKPEGKGTGLGLHTSARIVEGHGGFLHVRTELGQGTTFEAYLPKVEGSQSEASQPDGSAPPVGNQELILVVDDEEPVREMLLTTLQENGYRVASASNGAEALEWLRKHSEQPAVLLVDTEMPVMDGVVTEAAVLVEWPSLNVVRMSTRATPFPNAADRPTEITAPLSKPFTVAQLLSAMAEARSRKKS